MFYSCTNRDPVASRLQTAMWYLLCYKKGRLVLRFKLLKKNKIKTQLLTIPATVGAGFSLEENI